MTRDRLRRLRGLLLVALVSGACGYAVRAWIAWAQRPPAWRVESSETWADDAAYTLRLDTMRQNTLMATPVWVLVLHDKASRKEVPLLTVESVFQEHSPKPAFKGISGRTATIAIGSEEVEVAVPYWKSGAPGTTAMYLGGPR